jgi:hypothetical protein
MKRMAKILKVQSLLSCKVNQKSLLAFGLGRKVNITKMPRQNVYSEPKFKEINKIGIILNLVMA